MFTNELNGYNKQEVDTFIASQKARYEASLMQEKLKVLEAEKKLLEYRNKSYEIEDREKNIMSALDAFRRYQDEGNNNIKALHYEQIKMINEQIKLMRRELILHFPQLQNVKTFNQVFEDLENVLSQAKEPAEPTLTSPSNTENDSMRMLLTKMQVTRNKSTEPIKEVHIYREAPEPNESGFDLREAINPKEDLAEIMKAFDFYNHGDDTNLG